MLDMEQEKTPIQRHRERVKQMEHDLLLWALEAADWAVEGARKVIGMSDSSSFNRALSRHPDLDAEVKRRLRRRRGTSANQASHTEISEE